MLRLSLLLVAAALGATVAAAQLCADGEVYDHYPPTETLLSSTVRGYKNPGPCVGNRYPYVLEYVQLFTPPSVPYTYTDVCFALSAADLSSFLGENRIIKIVAYEAGTDYAPVGAVTELYTGTLSETTVGLFEKSFTLSTPFTVFRPKVYIGIYVLACANGGGSLESSFKLVGTTSNVPGRIVYHRVYSGSTLAWQQLASSSARAVTIRAMGAPSSAVPTAAWTCDNSAYKDGSVCDCECGEYDPDCGGSYTSTTTCTAGEVCNSVGQCDTVDWTADELMHYDRRDGCDCYSATADLDCNDPFQVELCEGQPMAAASTCSAGSCTPDASLWTCPSTDYRDGALCDCGCGAAVDPDCSNMNTANTCTNDEICSADGTCLYPRKWTCDVADYNNGVQCDCESCGAYDLDCSVPSVTASTCAATEFCNASNLCDLIPPFVSSSSSSADSPTYLSSESSATDPVQTGSDSTSSDGNTQPDPDPTSTSSSSSSSSENNNEPAGSISSSGNGGGETNPSSVASTAGQVPSGSNSQAPAGGFPVWMIAVIAVGGLLVVGAIIAVAIVLAKSNKKKKKKAKQVDDVDSEKPSTGSSVATELAPLPVVTTAESFAHRATPEPAATAAAAEAPTEAAPADGPKKEERVAFVPPSNDTTSVIHDSAGNTMFVLGKDANGDFTYSDASGSPLRVEKAEDGSMVVVYTK